MFGIVPMTEQLTEQEEIALRKSQAQPWDAWEEPQVTAADLALLRIQAEGDQLYAEIAGQRLGLATSTFLDGLGEETTYPDTFVGKLSPRLQAQVINERIDKTPPRLYSLVTEGEKVVRIFPGNREVIPPALVADRVYDRLTQRYGELTVEEAVGAAGEFYLRFLTPYQEGIPGALLDVRPDHPYLNREDVLALGVQVRHEYREGLEVSLFVKRLVCLNGLTADRHAYSWRVKEDRGVNAQLHWLDDNLEALPKAFNQIMERATAMTQAKIEGHPRTALQQVAKAMKLPNRLVPGLFAAFDQEPGDNQWALLNAITRTATHGKLDDGTRRDLWNTAGDWISDFDEVRAVLPRAIARNVGARIIEN